MKEHLKNKHMDFLSKLTKGRRQQVVSMDNEYA
jgi:hypothetical protein